jgi:hypothetical protein
VIVRFVDIGGIDDDHCLSFPFIMQNSMMIKITDGLVLFMVINATFNNISVISWRSVLLVEET